MGNICQKNTNNKIEDERDITINFSGLSKLTELSGNEEMSKSYFSKSELKVPPQSEISVSIDEKPDEIEGEKEKAADTKSVSLVVVEEDYDCERIDTPEKTEISVP